MILTATTDSIELSIESSGHDLDCLVDYIDRVTSTGAIGVADRQPTTSTTGTATILSAPASDTTRKVNMIHIRNAHASDIVNVVVQFNANGTIYELLDVTIFPDESIQWTPDCGWVRIDNRAATNKTRIHDVTSMTPTAFTNAILHETQSTAAHFLHLSTYIPFQASTRQLAVLACVFHTVSVATTVGIGLGLDFNHADSTPAMDSRNGVYGTTTNSPTAGVIAVQQIGNNASPPFSQGPASGTVMNLMFGAKQNVPFTDTDFPSRLSLVIIEEAAAQILIQSGSWMEVVEITG